MQRRTKELSGREKKQEREVSRAYDSNVRAAKLALLECLEAGLGGPTATSASTSRPRPKQEAGNKGSPLMQRSTGAGKGRVGSMSTSESPSKQSNESTASVNAEKRPASISVASPDPKEIESPKDRIEEDAVVNETM